MHSQLYRAVLGPLFDELPPQVRALHTITDRSIWSGKADVQRGTSMIAKLAALIARLPPTGKCQPLTVTLVAEGGGELWQRSFDGRIFASYQSADDKNVRERIGPIRLELVPSVRGGTLRLRLKHVQVFGVPMPWFLVPIVETSEFDAAGQYRFEVEARFHLFGLLIRYSGWLEPLPPPTLEAPPTSPAIRPSLPHTSGR